MLARGASAEALRAAIARLAQPVSKRPMTTAAQVQRAGIGEHKVGGGPGLSQKPGRTRRRRLGLAPLVWMGGRGARWGSASADISLAEARKRVAELRVDRHQGANPIEARQHKRADALAAARKQKQVPFREALGKLCRDAFANVEARRLSPNLGRSGAEILLANPRPHGG